MCWHRPRKEAGWLWPGAGTGQIPRNTWPHANPRHHATVLMFENMAMIDEIASYRERDVNYSWVGLAGTVAPVSNAGAGAIGVDERYAIMRIPLAKIWLGTFVWSISADDTTRNLT
jgi:hypothetical protein